MNAVVNDPAIADNNPTPSDPPAADPAPADPPTNTPDPDPGDWRAAVPEDYRNHPAIKEVDDVGKLAENYISLQKYLGQPALRPLDENASEEARLDWERQARDLGYYRAPDDADGKRRVLETLGLPEDPTGYKLPLPEGIDPDNETVAAFRQAAHQLGMTQEQAAGFFEQATQAQLAEQQRAVEQQRAGMEALRTEWAEAYEGRVALAKAVKERLFDQHLGDAFKSTDISKLDAGTVRLMAELGRQLGAGEGGKDLVREAAEAKTGMTRAEAKEKIGAIRSDRKHPFHNVRDPRHADAVAEMQKLYEVSTGRWGKENHGPMQFDDDADGVLFEGSA